MDIKKLLHICKEEYGPKQNTNKSDESKFLQCNQPRIECNESLNTPRKRSRINQNTSGFKL